LNIKPVKRKRKVFNKKNKNEIEDEKEDEDNEY
jgi:hypothetical protein